MITKMFFLLVFCFNLVLCQQSSVLKKYESNLKKQSASDSLARSKIDIFTVMKPTIIKIQKLYTRNYAAGKRPEGRIEIKYAINDTGEVFFTKVLRNDLHDTIFGNKIEKLLRDTRYPDISTSHPKDTTEIVWPFIFKDNESTSSH